MGDKNAPDEFGAVFQGAIDTWQASVTKKNGGFFGRSPSEDVECSCGVTLFADDVFEKSWAQRMNMNIRWQGGWARCGLRQNAGKLVILPNLRRTVENRKFSRKKQEYQIKASHRFLGIVYPAMLSMGAEIDQRIWATNRAWRELYGMWWNKRVPYKIKRTFFRGAVCGASLTGLTALLLHDRDHLRLQRCLEKKLRALMLGTASWEGPDHIRTLSSRQVRKRWRLALLHTSSVYKGSGIARHAHLLCCWFGRMHFVSRLHPVANGYAKRSLAYLQTLAFVPEWTEQVANVETEFGDVFRLGSKLNEWFLSLDLRQFRAAFITQTVAPCRVELSDDEGDDDLEGENENYICTLLDEDEWECGQRCRRHERSQHINVTQGRTHGKPKKSVLLVRFDTCQYWDNIQTHGSSRYATPSSRRSGCSLSK